MANQKHLDILKQGVNTWNQWRQDHPDIQPNLTDANLSRVRLSETGKNDTSIWIDFSRTNLTGAKLYSADLGSANFSAANLCAARFNLAFLNGANLSGANLNDAHFNVAALVEANLSGTTMNGTILSFANLTRANLDKADFSNAKLAGTVLGDVDLRPALGLDSVKHLGPSEISVSTIYRSQGQISEVFLKGAGVDDTFITYIRSLVKKPIDYYTCFISYSSKDKDFAERLHADLQSKGVRCWFAPEDMKIGDKIRPRIDESIRLYDKLLLVLSEHSVASLWVEHEVETAMGKELEGKPNVLFPIRLDQAIMDSKTGWASHVRLMRHIGDFTHWKNHDEYQKAFNRLLRDLKASSSDAGK